MSVLKVYKRDGSLQEFNIEKITNAIFKAAQACGGDDKLTAGNLAKQVFDIIEIKFKESIPTVEEIQNIVEKVAFTSAPPSLSAARASARDLSAAARASSRALRAATSAGAASYF